MIFKRMPNTLRRSSTHYKMQDQRYYRKHKEQVNHAACHMEHGETADPSDQQNHKQYRPDAHEILLVSKSFGPCDRIEMNPGLEQLFRL